MLDWYIALFVDSTYPHTSKGKGNERQGQGKENIIRH